MAQAFQIFQEMETEGMTSREFRYREYIRHLERNLKPGVFYGDCRFHPMVCIGINKRTGNLMGVSLVDGQVGYCSYRICSVRLLTPKDALRRRLHGLPPKELKPYMEFEERYVPEEYKKKQEELSTHFPGADKEEVGFVEAHVGKGLRRRK